MPSRRDQFEARVDGAVPYLTAVGLVGAVLLTACSDVPDDLPGIALGSTALFYFERGIAAMAVAAVGTMLLVRGLKRETPSEASPTGIGYPDKVKEAVATSDAALKGLTERVDKIEPALEKYDRAIKLLAEAISALEKQIQGLKQNGDIPEKP